MKQGAQAVVRVLGKRSVLLLLALGAFALAGDPRGAGVEAGILVAAALAVHAIVFGVAATIAAAPPTALRTGAAAAVLLAAGAGVWAARGAAFDFFGVRAGALTLAPGGALLHLAAFMCVAGAGAFIFLCIAGRATALEAERSRDAAPGARR